MLRLLGHYTQYHTITKEASSQSGHCILLNILIIVDNKDNLGNHILNPHTNELYVEA